MDKTRNSKRMFLIGWDNRNPAIIKAVKKLEARGYEILYWTVVHKEAMADNKKIFPLTQFHWHYEAINFIPPSGINEADFAPPGEDLLKNLYEIESVLSTMKQFYKQSSSMLAKKHLFHRLIQYWYGTIEKYKPEIIIFSYIPHSVYDYTIYSLAKFLKIKTIVFAYAGVTDRYLLTDLKDGSAVLREEYLKNKNQQFKLEDLSPDMRNFYNWHLDNQAGKIKPELKQALKKWQGVNKLSLKFKIIVKSFRDLSFFKKLVGYLKKEFGPNMKKEYLALEVAPDYNKKYIYVALHSQPESSTCPLGGVFVDQILMVKILSYCLPKDWLIYVKEHPIQWATSSLAYFEFRYKGYYRELAKIKNVRLVPIEANSHELIINSQAVCTVNGTAGMEACLRLKPTLLFGYISYQDYPGVFKVKNVTACREAIEKIVSGFKVDRQQIINYLFSLDKITYHLNIHESIKSPAEISEEDMAERIFSIIEREAELAI